MISRHQRKLVHELEEMLVDCNWNAVENTLSRMMDQTILNIRIAAPYLHKLSPADGDVFGFLVDNGVRFPDFIIVGDEAYQKSPEFYIDTLLHMACIITVPERIIVLLIRRGLDPNITGYNGFTCLYYALPCNSISDDEGGHAEVMKALLDNGANPNKLCDDRSMTTGVGYDITPVNKFGTLLHYCIIRGVSVDIVELLLRYGANSTQPMLTGSESCIDLARRFQRDAVLPLLVANVPLLMDVDVAPCCGSCKTMAGLKCCRGCMSQKYCSMACAKSDWTRHRKECGNNTNQ